MRLRYPADPQREYPRAGGRRGDPGRQVAEVLLRDTAFLQKPFRHAALFEQVHQLLTQG